MTARAMTFNSLPRIPMHKHFIEIDGAREIGQASVGAGDRHTDG